MGDLARAGRGTDRRWRRGPGLVLAVALAVAPVSACGQERYEYGEKKLQIERPDPPSRTVDDLRAAASSSSAQPQVQMGEDLPLPAGLPADLSMPSEQHAVNLVTAHPGWFEWSVVLVDPPGPLNRVLRGVLDEAYEGFAADGVPVRRETRTLDDTGVKVDVVEAELDGRAVEISLEADGYHLDYAVENAR